MNFRVFEDAGSLCRGAAEEVLRVAESRAAPVIALSGGSTPKALYEILGAGEARERLAARAVTWVVGDERCVPPEDTQSNARMIRETLFAQGMPESHRFLRFRTELGAPYVIAAAFEDDWRSLGLNRLDLALLGVGEDGHTASLFPGTPALVVEDRIATALYVETLKMWRVTLTRSVLQGALLKLVLAAGASKAPVVARARKGEEMPVTIVAGENADGWWLVDRAAYALPGLAPEGTVSAN